MINKIYKSILVALLSVSILMLNFSSREPIPFINTVQAEELHQQEAGSAMSAANLLSTLTGMAVGLLASKLYTYKMTPDIMIAAVGGVAFVGGDLVALFKQDSDIKELTTQITRDSNGNVDQKQIETLKALKKSNEIARDTASTKKNLQTAGAAAFTTAAATALFFGVTDEISEKACISGLLTATTAAYATSKAKCVALHSEFAACMAACSAAMGSCTAGCIPIQTQAIACDVETTACKTKIEVDAKGVQQFIALRVPPGPSSPALAQTTALATSLTASIPTSAATCAVYSTEMAAAEQAGMCVAYLQTAVLRESGAPPIKVAEVIKQPDPAPAPAEPAPAPAAQAQATPVANQSATATDLPAQPAAQPAAAEPEFRFMKTDPGVYDRAQQFLNSNGLNSSSLPTKGQRSNLKDDRLQILFDHSEASHKPAAPTNQLKKYFNKALDLIMPSAEAGSGGLIGIAAKSAVGYLLNTCQALTVLIDNQMLTPLRRAVIWGVLAGMATVSVMAMSSEENKIEENIASIDRILNTMNGLNNGVQTTQASLINSSSNSLGLTKNSANAINGNADKDIDLSKAGLRFPCITGDDQNNCASVSSKMLTMPMEGLPPILQDRIANVRNMGDGLNGSGVLSASTMGQARLLGSRANAVNAELMRLRKEAQSKLKANEKNLSLEAEHNRLDESLKSAVQKNLNENKISTENALASLSSAGLRGWTGSSGGPSGRSAIDSANAVIKKNSPSANAISTPVRVASIPSSAFKLDSANDDLKTKQAEDEAAKTKALAEEEAKKPKSMDEFVLGNDINKDKDTSLFDIISTRYKKSYNRIFETIK